MASHQGDGVDGSRRWFVVPSGPAPNAGPLLLQRVGGQDGKGEEAQQYGRGAGDGKVGPLALGLHTEVGAHLLKGDFQLPAQDKPFQDLGWVRRRISAEQSLGSKAPWGSRASTQQMVTGGLPERYQTAVCEVSSTMRVVPSYQDTAATIQLT